MLAAHSRIKTVSAVYVALPSPRPNDSLVLRLVMRQSAALRWPGSLSGRTTALQNLALVRSLRVRRFFVSAAVCGHKSLSYFGVVSRCPSWQTLVIADSGGLASPVR